MFDRAREDINTVFERDPAARSKWDVIFSYPGFQALQVYRLANWFWMRKFTFIARFLSHFARVVTGIEIHPGATIGKRFFVDHGMGVVIGETAEIGNDVTLYQGVTLGGTSLNESKRHPTLGNDVIVGAGAKVLGPITLGNCSRVGSNAVVIKDVPECATVVGIPGKIVSQGAKAEKDAFVQYGITGGDLPDPIARAMEDLLDEVHGLQARIDEMEARQSGKLVDLPCTPDSDAKAGLSATSKAG